MLHSDANDQSRGPFQSVSQTPWQGPEKELYQEEGRPLQSIREENRYWPEAQYYQSLQEEPVQTAWQESPPLWNTSGKLSVAPSVRSSARGSQSIAILALTMVIASVFGVGLFAGWTFSKNAGASLAALLPGANSNNIEAAREAAIAKVGPAVVQVNVTSVFGWGERVDHASGVIVDKQGHIVTNNHVVQQGELIEVVFADGNKIENVQVTGTDPMDDLAVLQINPPANIVVATLGDSSKLQAGQDVLAIGNPLGLKETVTHGIISALGRSEVDSSESDKDNAPMIPNTIQTDAPINQGSGGGALVDLQGNVIGISTLMAVDSRFRPVNGVGFAIPINQVKLVVPQIVQDGSVTHTGRAALGTTSNEVDASDNLSVDYGVYITGLTDNGPAEKAGLQEGDVIVAINGKEVDDESSLGDLLAAQSPGNRVSVSIYRGDQPMTLKVTLGELPATG